MREREERERERRKEISRGESEKKRWEVGRIKSIFTPSNVPAITTEAKLLFSKPSKRGRD